MGKREIESCNKGTEIVKNRAIELDLIRILAMGMVLAVHVGQLFSKFENITSVGAKGVQLFFVLSGYLAVASLEKDNNTKQYYKKRIVRIIPPYFACLCVIWVWDLFKYVFIYHDSFSNVLSANGPCGIKFIRFLTFSHLIIPSDNYGMWCNRYSLWTMSSFAFFYLLIPFVYKLINNFKRVIALLIPLLLLRPIMIKTIAFCLQNIPTEGHIEWFSYQNPMCEMYCFFLGVAVFFARKEKKEVEYAICLLICCILTKFDFYQYEIGFSVLMILLLNRGIEIRNRKLEKTIIEISSASFAVYLFHPLIISIFESLEIMKIVYHFPQIVGFSFMYLFLLSFSYMISCKILSPMEYWVSKKVLGK